MSGETEDNVSGWSVDTLHAHMQQQLRDLIVRLDERKEAQEEAIRVQTASLEKEFHEHLIQYRHEVTLAFEASDKAIMKAETATEKRFDSVNEFRGQLSDQAALFMPREVAETQLADSRNKIADLASQINSMHAVQLQAQRNLTISLTVATIVISIIVILANNVFGN